MVVLIKLTDPCSYFALSPSLVAPRDLPQALLPYLVPFVDGDVEVRGCGFVLI